MTRATRLKDLLNTPLATALTRLIVFSIPVVTPFVGYATYHWINQKIADAPSVVFVTTESAETKRRVTELEVQGKLRDQREEVKGMVLTEIQSDVKSMAATVNKIAGAMEVRSGVKLTTTPSIDTTIAASP